MHTYLRLLCSCQNATHYKRIEIHTIGKTVITCMYVTIRLWFTATVTVCCISVCAMCDEMLLRKALSGLMLTSLCLLHAETESHTNLVLLLNFDMFIHCFHLFVVVVPDSSEWRAYSVLCRRICVLVRGDTTNTVTTLIHGYKRFQILTMKKIKN